MTMKIKIVYKFMNIYLFNLLVIFIFYHYMIAYKTMDRRKLVIYIIFNLYSKFNFK